MIQTRRNLLKIVSWSVFFAVYTVYSFASEEKCFVIGEGVLLNVSMHEIDDEQSCWCGKAVIMAFDLLSGQKKQIASLCFSFNKRTHAGEIDALFVEEPFRRRGYGILLMTSVCNQLEALNIELIHLKVRATNIVAINLYFNLSCDLIF